VDVLNVSVFARAPLIHTCIYIVFSVCNILGGVDGHGAPQALELNPKHPLVGALNQARLNENNAVSSGVVQLVAVDLLSKPLMVTRQLIYCITVLPCEGGGIEEANEIMPLLPSSLFLC